MERSPAHGLPGTGLARRDERSTGSPQWSFLVCFSRAGIARNDPFGSGDQPGLAVSFQEVVHSEPLCEGGYRQTTIPHRRKPRMDSHKNARTTAHSRAEIARRVFAGIPVATVARAFGVCDRTVRKWADRARLTSLPLEDGSWRPQSSPTTTSAGVTVETERLRRLRRTGAEIAEILQVSPATVSRTLQLLRLNKLSALEPPAVVQRYEWLRPGQLVHVDVKKLGRIGLIGHRITGDRHRRARGIGSTCASMIFPVFLPSKCCLKSGASPWRASCAGRWRGSARGASWCSACCPTTARAISRTPLPPLAAGCT